MHHKTNVLERIFRQCFDELHEDACWTTCFSPSGAYGHVRVRLDDSSYRLLHRIAWEAYNAEPVPEGLVVMHSCDNAGCFNPAHLSIGTQQQNIIDSVLRGRDRWAGYQRKYPSKAKHKP